MCTVPCIDSRLFVTSCSRRALRRSVRRSGGERACVRNTGPPHSRAACATHGHCLGTLGAQGCTPAARGSPASPWEGTLGAGVRAGRRRAWTCITTYLSALSPALVGSRIAPSFSRSATSHSNHQSSIFKEYKCEINARVAVDTRDHAKWVRGRLVTCLRCAGSRLHCVNRT